MAVHIEPGQPFYVVEPVEALEINPSFNAHPVLASIVAFLLLANLMSYLIGIIGGPATVLNLMVVHWVSRWVMQKVPVPRRAVPARAP